MMPRCIVQFGREPQHGSSKRSISAKLREACSARAKAAGLVWFGKNTMPSGSPEERCAIPSDASTASGGASYASTDFCSYGGDLEPGSPDRRTDQLETWTFFDWDDTLFPMTWYKAVRLGHLPESSTADKKQLQEHAELIEASLRTARALGRVAIVTLSNRPWVFTTANHVLPELHIDALLKELGIDVYYAKEESAERTQNEEWEELKAAAMQRCITKWQQEGGQCQSLFSVGDSLVEHRALRGLFMELPLMHAFLSRPYCKTLKLMERPGLAEIKEELRQIVRVFLKLAVSPKDVELVIDTPSKIATDLCAFVETVPLQRRLDQGCWQAKRMSSCLISSI